MDKTVQALNTLDPRLFNTRELWHWLSSIHPFTYSDDSAKLSSILIRNELEYRNAC